MSITSANWSEQASGITQGADDNAFATSLRRSHERTALFVGDARRASARLSASTQQFSDATQTLTGLLAQFRLP
jgi:hypothetical protein